MTFIKKVNQQLTTHNISQEDISSDQPPLHQSTTADTHSSNGYQQEFRNIWAALHTLFTNNVNTGSEIFSIMQQERSANQKLNEEIRILLRENISLKTDNHHLNEKIIELESILKSYQEPGEWIKPKKTVTWENAPTPPTWEKLNSNKFDPLTDFDILDLDSASDDDSHNEYEKVSFNDQLRTVQLQRRVQFLQRKLIEKSSQQSESKEQAKYTKTSNRAKSERTKILPNHQETSNQQGRNVHKNKPNNKVLSTKLPHKKDNTKDLPPKRDQSTMKTKEHKKTVITIAGDYA